MILLALPMFMQACFSTPPKRNSQKMNESDTVVFDDFQPYPFPVVNDIKNYINSSYLPSPPYIYPVKIYIERDKDGNYARSVEDIVKDFDKAEEFFSPIMLSFPVVDVIAIDVEKEKPTQRDYKHNANFYNQYICVYYFFGHKYVTVTGLSSFPWDKNPYGIIVNGEHADHFTLSHELGHYFGLYHTFEKNDYVRDTCSRDEWELIGNGEDYSSYDNLMNYSDFKNAHLTLGQLERVKFFIKTMRSSTLIRSEAVENLLQPNKVYGRHDDKNILLITP